MCPTYKETTCTLGDQKSILWLNIQKSLVIKDIRFECLENGYYRLHTVIQHSGTTNHCFPVVTRAIRYPHRYDVIQQFSISIAAKSELCTDSKTNWFSLCHTTILHQCRCKIKLCIDVDTNLFQALSVETKRY